MTTLERRLPMALLAILALLTLGFAALYIFLPPVSVLRDDGFDAGAHLDYFLYVYEHPSTALAFRGSYTWVHFPAFYRLNAVVADLACRVLESCGAEAQRLQSARLEGARPGLLRLEGVRVAWFLQAILRVGTLSVLLATFRRLFASSWAVALALALCALSPRVFFTTCIWNQDDYVFFFASLCMYAAVGAAVDGLNAGRIVLAAAAVALGFQFKLTILIPAAAMLLCFLLLPDSRASRTRKAAALAVMGALFLLVNWNLLTTRDGLDRLLWHRTTQYPRDRRNDQNLFGAYLTVNPGPFLRPEPIYVPTSKTDWAGKNSFTTGMLLYLFELHHHFQGPPRNWLNLLCVWSGLPLFAVTLWRSGRTAVAVARRQAAGLAEVYCASLLLLSAVAVIYLSRKFPFGWTPHVEYVIAAYPAAAVLLVQFLPSIRRSWPRRAWYAIVAIHLVANLLMIFHAARYKIGLYL